MDSDNHAKRLKKRLLIEISKLAFNDRLKEDIDKLPVKLFPKNAQNIRCCIHKDRAVTKYRIQAILGFKAEDETDETTSLSEYVEIAKKRQNITESNLTVLSDACSACLKGRHYITNVCKGCVARPCTVVCPKNAISMIDGHAVIDENLCIDCGKCLKVCPYHAIVNIPIPCEDSCPVNAISKDENGLEVIDETTCINCGKCMLACPFGAITEQSQIIDVITKLKSKQKVAALLAPAIAGQFPYDFQKVIAATRKLGFDKVYEVATGAKETAITEAKEFEHKMQEGSEFMTTSCCPAYMEFVEKHSPELKEYVSDTPTPMHFTGKMVKDINNEDIVTVFISPCPAKRVEALKDNTIDYVLSAEEYGSLFVAAEIEIIDCDAEKADIDSEENGRGFPVIGGVLSAVKNYVSNNIEIKPVVIDGLDKNNCAILKSFTKGKCPGNLVEVMSCAGGCVGGVNTIETSVKATYKVSQYKDKQ